MPIQATLEEMTAWSNREVGHAVYASLPEGWTFLHGCDPVRGWWAVIQSPEEKVEWQQAHGLDERVVLFSAYGWLRFREHTPRHPVWARRSREPTKPTVGKMHLPGVNVPDPDDLDRDKILAEVAVQLPELLEDPTKRR